MSEVSVDSSAIIKVNKLCINAEKEMEYTIALLKENLHSILVNWKDQKSQEFEILVNQCIVAMKQPLNDLSRCNLYLQRLYDVMVEYENIHFDSASSSVLSSNSFLASNGINFHYSNEESNTGIDRTFGIPHFYDTTREIWHSRYGSETYDSPHETGQLLNSHQGVPPSAGGEGVMGYKGTCGLVSCQNVLRMAGLTITEADVVNYARNTRAGLLGMRRLCTTNSRPSNNGATYASDRQQILRHFGVDSTIESGTIDNISRYVAEGRGVIISIEANRFWGNRTHRQEGHAVTVTSVERDTRSGNPIGFYICDSGRGVSGDDSRYVTVAELQESLFGSINVTTRVIR